MSSPLTSYHGVLRTQLATTLRPAGNEAAQQVALFCHRVLTQLMIKAQTLPGLRQTALGEFAGLLDPLAAELRAADANAALIAELAQGIRTQPDYGVAEKALQKAVPLLAQRATPAAHDLQRRIAAILLRVQQAVHEAARAQEMGPVSTDAAAEPLGAEQKQAFRDFLRKNFPQETQLDIGNTKAVMGGASKQTIFVELKHAPTLPASVVLRVDRADSAVGSTVADEYELIRTLYAAGMPVPQPFALEADKATLGGAFIVVSRIDGHNIGDAFDVAEPTREFAVTLAQALAKLHNLPLDQARQLPGATISTRERMLAEMDVFEATWRKLEVPSVALEMAYAWLRANIHLSEGRRAIVHRDVGCHNMLGKDGRLAAILDWETAVIGNPAHDLGYAYHTVTQMVAWDDFLAAYAAAGGVVPTPAEIDFYRMWRSVWIMGFMLVARSYVEAGITTEPIGAYAAQYWFQRSELVLHEMIERVLTLY